VLIVAFHFPPFGGSSGVLRSLKYCRYLPDFGWQPVVLAPDSRAYDHIDLGSLKSIPENVAVLRSFALDTQRHLSIRGRYPRVFALPDRWVSWVLGGALTGFRAIRRLRIEAIYTTFPIMSAAVIGLVLQRWTGLPWVLDLRDPMTEEDYPRDPTIHWVWRRIEKRCMRRASRVVVTAESTRKMYLQRYPALLTPEKCVVIRNGYDEEDFQNLWIPLPGPVPDGRPVRLVHSGLIYPEERDPRPMFNAVARLKHEGRISAATLQIVFRAPGEEDLYRRLLAEKGIEDIIALEPRLPYREALQECAEADGLLLFQAANCELQIPAKAYEYFRLGKPILALTTHTGDTAALLREVGGATIVDLADEGEIHGGLSAFLKALRSGIHPLPSAEIFRRYSRRAQAGQLAGVLAEITAGLPASETQKAQSLAQ